MEEEMKFCPECGKPFKKSYPMKTIALIVLLAFLLTFTFTYSQSRITELNKENLFLRNENNILKDKLLLMDVKINTLKEENNLLMEELKRHKLKRPTLEELKAFLEEDNLSEYSYKPYKYDCDDFARDLRINAKAKGLNISIIMFEYDVYVSGRTLELAHAMNGVWLSDGKWVFIEPQNDEIIFANGPEDSLALRRYASELEEVDENSIKIVDIVIIW